MFLLARNQRRLPLRLLHLLEDCVPAPVRFFSDLRGPSPISANAIEPLYLLRRKLGDFRDGRLHHFGCINNVSSAFTTGTLTSSSINNALFGVELFPPLEILGPSRMLCGTWLIEMGPARCTLEAPGMTNSVPAKGWTAATRMSAPGEPCTMI